MENFLLLTYESSDSGDMVNIAKGVKYGYHVQVTVSLTYSFLPLLYLSRKDQYSSSLVVVATEFIVTKRWNHKLKVLYLIKASDISLSYGTFSLKDALSVNRCLDSYA